MFFIADMAGNIKKEISLEYGRKVRYPRLTPDSSFLAYEFWEKYSPKLLTREKRVCILDLKTGQSTLISTKDEKGELGFIGWVRN